MRRLIALACTVVLIVAWTLVPRLPRSPRVALAQFGRTRTRVSPHEGTEATIDGARLSIVYGRPSMRGRVIFGGLVRYGLVWCPGADECTKLTTTHALQFGRFRLDAGAYTLWMLPTETKWTLIFNSNAEAFHTGRDVRQDVGRIDLERRTLSAPVEQLTFSIEKHAAASGGAIVMSWETTCVSAPFTVIR